MNPIEIKTNKPTASETMTKVNSMTSSITHSAKSQTQTGKSGFNLTKRKNRNLNRKGW